MKNKLSGILTLLLAFVVQIGFAQQEVITGTVTDPQGMPLPGVNVVVEGTNRGTQTDFEGNYSLRAANGEELVFSYLGFADITRTVGESTTINVTMQEDAAALAEVVVVGYGTRDKTDVVGSVSQINAEVLEERPTANVLDAMQGRVAGLQIFSSTGEPSGTPSIRLHGAGSLGAGSTPLILLDGFPIDASRLVSLNPEDIEDMTVLKDASATSIYGSRAANGVVFITTKNGRKEKEPSINLSIQHGISNLANTEPFERFMNTEQLLDFWGETGIRSAEQIAAIRADWGENDTQWYETYYKQDAPTTQANLSVSGGSEKTSYYISGGYFTQEGLAYRSGYDRFNLRSNLTTEVNDWIGVGLNLALGYDERQTNQYGSNNLNRGLAPLSQPYYTPTDPATGEPYDYIPGLGRYHPNYLADMMPGDQNNILFNPSGYIQLTPFEGFTLKTQGGLDVNDRRSTARRLPSYMGNLGYGSNSESFYRFLTMTITNTAEYRFDLADVHNFSILGGHEYIDYDYEYFNAYSEGQTDDRLNLLEQGPENRDVAQSSNEYVFESFFGRLGYNFNQTYYVDFTVRQDGSSRFGENNRYANFWAVGGMWKAKNEAFLEDVDWLGELTFRASHGTSGNADIGNYNSLALVGTTQYAGQTGWALSTPGNPSLSWESQTKTTVGVNIDLFDRARLDVEYYNRETEDMLIDVPYPYTSGFSDVTSNVGSMVNRGVDVNLELDVFRNDDLYVTPYVNFNYNKNEVTELFQGRDYWIIPNTGVSWAVGEPVSFFYPVFAGVNTETGLPEWYVPGDNIVDPTMDPDNVTTTFVEADLQQSTGINRWAPWNGGFGVNAGYKGFYLNAAFTFSEGKYLINNDRYFFENPQVFAGYNTSTRVTDYWQEPGDEALFPRIGVQFTQFDSRLIEDASFVRLKTLSVGYNIPASFTDQIGPLDGMKIYFVGRNLLTWTEYLGPDPEVDSNLTLGANPNTKQLTLGVDFQF